MPNPRLNPAVFLSPVEGGYVAYDPVRDHLHQLNPVAALLTELSDGSRSLDEIRELAAPFLPEGQLDEIDRWIETGLKAGLLVSESDGATARELTPAELLALSKRLRALGNIQASYLCAKRTVELKPDEWDGWYDLGDLCQCLSRRDEARQAYQKYFDHHPDDGEIEHLLIALRDEAPPPRASDRAIQHIYKAFAASYETRMRDDLKYVGPERIADALNEVAGGDTFFADVLDLGCGSGLAGVMIRPRAGKLTGVDLSPDMIELARARNIYDRLEVAEITAWLDGGEEPFDLIQSIDCLIYFGDLGDITRAAARRLKPGGYFAMSMERGSRPPFHLSDTGRYTHHPDHVRQAAAKAGLAVARMDESFLRMEWGEEVMGLYAILARPPGAVSWLAAAPILS